MQHTPHPDQVRLEEKAAAILETKPDREKSVEAVFGPMENWTFQIDGDWKLMLIPFTRQWWFFDRVHADWQATGFEAGEAVFYVENNLLGVEPIKTTVAEGEAASIASGSDDKPGPDQAHFCTECGSAIQPGDRFCRGCGKGVEK